MRLADGQMLGGKNGSNPDCLLCLILRAKLDAEVLRQFVKHSCADREFESIESIGLLKQPDTSGYGYRKRSCWVRDMAGDKCREAEARIDWTVWHKIEPSPPYLAQGAPGETPVLHSNGIPD
jgi:hypothetical protein